VKRSLFLSLLFFHAVSSFASGWIPFTATPRTGAAAFDQSGAEVASNGFDYLAGWTSTIRDSNPPRSAGVYVARVNADASLAAPIATPLDPSAIDARGLSISAGRDGYFASWISEKGLNVAILDSFGRTERRTTIAAQPSSRTLTAWNGAVHLVLAGFDGPFDAALFDDNGNVIASDIPVGDSHGDTTIKVALTNDDAGFLVLATKRVADSRDDIYGRRISSSGVTSDWFLVRSVASPVLGLAVTSDGARDVIAWGDSFGVWTLDLNSNSNAAGASRQLVPDSAAVGQALVQSGRTWITYRTSAAAFAITIGPDGQLTAPLSLGNADAAGIASNGATLLAVYSAQPGETIDRDVNGRFVTPVAAAVPFLISKSETDQEHGDLATDNAANAVAVWDEKISTQHQVFVTPFASRMPLDPAGIQISSTGDNVHPAIAFNGTNYLAVWTRTIGSDSQIVFRRISPEGIVLDGQDVVIGEGDGNSRVASDGHSWLVMWPRYGFGLQAARVSAEGVVMNGQEVPSTSAANQSDLDLAWNGSLYVAAWRNLYAGTHRPTYIWITAAWIAPDLTRFDLRDLTDRVGDYSNPRVAVSGSRTLVAWQATSGTQYRVIEGILSLGRTRAVGGVAVITTIAGATLLDATNDGDRLALLTQRTIPFDGVYETVIDTQSTSLRFALEPGEQLMGKAISHNGTLWMSESLFPSIFDPAAAARRLYVREF